MHSGKDVGLLLGSDSKIEEKGAPSIWSDAIPEKRIKAALACTIEKGEQEFTTTLQKENKKGFACLVSFVLN
jgi:hypothetical protein